MNNHLEVTPGFVECSLCGGDVWLTVWGEGIDSSIECVDCGEKNIYR